MPLNRLFDAVERVRDTAQWRAAFGEPQVFEDRTVIPVAQVGYGFGLGFGHPAEIPEDEAVLAAEGRASPITAWDASDQAVRFAAQVTDLDADALRTGAADIQARANDALTDLRSVLGVLRDAGTGALANRPQPTFEDVPALVAEARAAGARCCLPQASA